ncbi:hypothetical protein C1646_766470 [Rhizophagus diaphanus]|nr:hypothetical protein C1646_766470 [Rhizophagus diaphanus] [Rhizophagus sp. MUCL 43196]
MDNRTREDTIHKGKCRDIVDRIIESIKYSQQPTMREKGLRIIIVVIVRDCIEGNLKNEVFQKFWEWYDTILEMGMKLDRISDENVAGEPEDSEGDEGKNSPESYEFEEGASDEYEIMKEDGIEWSVDLLKGKIEEMDGRFMDKDIQRIWNLCIRMELVLTEDFLSAFFERKNLSDEKLKDEIKDWLEQETIECMDCENRKLPYMIKSSTGQCENCEQKELLELKDDLEKLGYEMDISEIQRIRNFRISNSVIVTTEFMEKYIQVIDLEEKELKIQLYEWINENTTFCDECGIRWINSKFDEGKIKCRDCENDENEIDIRIKRLKQICNDAKIEQEWKTSENSGNKSDDEESNGSEEILSPNNSDNNENFEELQEENKEENIINIPDFDSKTNSEESDNSLKNLFKTPPETPPIVPIIMAARNEIREDIRAALLAATGHDVGENEDVNDWVNQFEIAFTAIGKNQGNNGVRQAAMAATCLRGAALQWYKEKKEAGAGNGRRQKMKNARIEENSTGNKRKYTQRFRQILRLATRGHALDDELQVDFYIEGLEPELGREEEALTKKARKEGKTYIKESKIEIQDDKPKNIFAKPLDKNYEDDLSKMFKKLEKDKENP